jgi:hypothetical protein
MIPAYFSIEPGVSLVKDSNDFALWQLSQLRSRIYHTHSLANLGNQFRDSKRSVFIDEWLHRKHVLQREFP